MYGANDPIFFTLAASVRQYIHFARKKQSTNQ